jgi:hypothetical protein
MECYFLRLSAELRNEIYAFALTEERPIIFRRGADRVGRLYICNEHGARQSNERDEANQLRFASRQLYIETRGLSIRYNSISFKSVRNTGIFLKSCRSHHRHIRKLHIRQAGRIKGTDPIWNSKHIHTIATFLCQFPRAIARLEVEGYDPHLARVYLHLVIAELLLKQTHHWAIALFARERVDSMVRGARLSMQKNCLDHGVAILPPNFRICLNHVPLNEELLRKDLEADAVLQRLMLHKVLRSVEDFIKLARRALEEGV